MAKKSVYQRNLKRIKKSELYKNLRMKLRNKIKSKTLSGDKIFSAVVEMQKMPRDSSPVRVRNRCYMTGRARGILPKFGLSRICFRKLANQNYLPGVSKLSW